MEAVEGARRRKKVEGERKVAEEKLRKQITENLSKLMPRDRLGAVSDPEEEEGE